MRIIIGTALLLTVILVFSFYTYFQISKITDEMTLTLNKLEQYIEREQWEESTQVIEKLQDKWKHAILWFNPLMDHREIDQLDHAIVRLTKLVNIEEKEDALVEVSLTKRMIHRVKDREKPILSNIF